MMPAQRELKQVLQQGGIDFDLSLSGADTREVDGMTSCICFHMLSNPTLTPTRSRTTPEPRAPAIVGKTEVSTSGKENANNGQIPPQRDGHLRTEKRAWMLWLPYALDTRTRFWFGHGCSGHRVLLIHERGYGLGTRTA